MKLGKVYITSLLAYDSITNNVIFDNKMSLKLTVFFTFQFLYPIEHNPEEYLEHWM